MRSQSCSTLPPATLRKNLGTISMNATTCPFCGLVTDVPHETQQTCIEALHAEIARVRGILDVARPTASPFVPALDQHDPR